MQCKCRQALEEIARYGETNQDGEPNQAAFLVQAFHREIVAIARSALNNGACCGENSDGRGEKIVSEYVTCQICKNRYKGVVPKGGDGSALRPRKHYRKLFSSLRRQKDVCPGSYQLADEWESGGKLVSDDQGK